MATKEEMKVTQASEGIDAALTPEMKAQFMSELKEELKKEVRAVVSGIYITGVKGLRGPLETPVKKKKGLFARFKK